MYIHKRNLVKNIAAVLIGLTLYIGLVAMQTTAATGGLKLSLNSSLDNEGAIKATSITKAELLGTDGTLAKTATITGGAAQFDLSGVAAGDYFIRMNGLADDLIPTRIDDPTQSINQFVGQRLRGSIIGNLSDQAYRTKTFSKGQGQHPVVIYSDGSNETPERYAYVILSLKTSPQKFEVRALGTASDLNSLTPSMANHPSTSTANNPQFSTWVLSESDHSDDYNGTDSKCNICHGSLDTKPATFSEVSLNSGWCYRCHYGKGGSYNGLMDAAALSAPTPTAVASTSTAATPAATTTQKTPAFEAMLGVSALLLVLLARRR